MKKKIFCFDLDNTICITKGQQYSKSKPIKEAIILINKLYLEGHGIKIFTSRYMGRNKDNIKNSKIIFSKSVSEILIEHGLIHRIFSQQSFKSDPIHLNDIQPVLKDGPYFKKGDLFLSSRNLSMIILYRPETNKIIKIIEGGFLNQHDVDILDDKTISIYNNNVLLNSKNGRSVTNNEIVIYHFDTNTFSKKLYKLMLQGLKRSGINVACNNM